MFTNLDLVLESTATLSMAATPSLFADYPCLQKANMYTCMDFDLDALQAGINMSHREKFLQQRASRRVAMKRLYQRHPVGTVCVEQVNSQMVVTTLILFLILNRIRSKSANRIKTCNRAAIVRAVMSHRAKSAQAIKSSETGSHHKDGCSSKVMEYITVSQCHRKADCSSKVVATTSPAMTYIETMCMFVVKGHMYLLMIIRQRLLMSGDVELNPGPLDALDLWSITNELGSVIDKWFRIGVQLRLSEAKLRQIEADHHTVDRCFSEVISFWFNGNTQVAVSWKSLVEVLESPFVDEKGLAKKLREKGGLELPDENATPSSTDNQPMTLDQSAHKSENSVVQLVSSEVDMPQEESPEHSHDLAQPKPKLTFPSLNLKKLSKEEKEQLHQRLYTESVDIMFKFQELFSSTTQSLEECSISPRGLYTHLVCLGSLKPTYDDPKQPVLRHYFPQLRQSKHIDEAMAIIGDYCSFFNYRIVELIINKLGTTKDKDNLFNYKKEFSEYAKRHVFECPSELGAITDGSGHATLFLTLDETYDNCTVSTLQLFVRKLAEILKLSSDAGLKLHRIEPGSLKLTFQIPIFIQEDIFPLSIEQRRALAGLGVVQLSCGEYQFTNEDEEVKLSGEVAGISEATIMMAGLSVGKPDDTESVTDSALETCSGFSGATSAQFSETRKTLVNGWMTVMPRGFGLIPRSWSRKWFVLKRGILYYYKSPDDTFAAGIVNMSGYSIASALEIKKENVFKVLHSKAKTYYFQADSHKEMTKWMRALTEAAKFSSTLSKHQAVGLSVVGQLADKGKSGASTADSAIGTSTRQSVVTGGTFVGGSQFSENLMERDLRDEPYLRMEHDAAKLRPSDDSSGLELHWASCRGELNKIKQLVENQHHNPLQKDKYGDTALHYAAIGGHLSTMRYFIEKQGLVPACQGQHGWTPLHHAAYYKHLELIKYLVGEQQVDPLCKGEDGYTSLHTACQGGDIDVIQFLINEIQKYMSLEDVIYERTKNGNTPFHLAALYGHLLVVKFFITNLNFDPNTPGFMGRPALHTAAQEGHLYIVEYLIEEVKCDPSCCPGENKATPLHMAAQQGHLDVVRYLTQKHHCNPLSRNSCGSTPLHNAALYAHFKVVEFFISELNCDPNTPGQWGRSPLHHASQGGSLRIVKYLIEEVNCNASQLDERQVTPLHMAAKKGHLDIVQYLIQDKLCNPLCRDMSRDTPLHYAAQEGHLEVVQYFIETLHCSPNIRGWRNMTPLELM